MFHDPRSLPPARKARAKKSQGGISCQIFIDYVHPSDRVGPAHQRRIVVRRGTTYRLKLDAIAAIFGTGLDIAKLLADCGAIEEVPRETGDNGRYYLFDPAWTRRHLYDRWVSGFNPTRHVEFAQFKRMHLFAPIPKAAPLPPHIIAAAAAMLLRVGAVNSEEIQGLLPLPAKPRPVVDAVVEAAGKLRRTHSLLGYGWRAEPAVLLAAFPILASLPRTCFSAGREEEHQPPSPAGCTAPLLMGPLAEIAAAFVTVLASGFRHPKSLDRHVPDLVIFDQVHARLYGDALPTAKTMRTCMDDVLSFEQHPDLTPSRRLSIRRTMLLAASILRRLVASAEPDAQGLLARLVPPEPTGRSAVLLANRRLEAEITKTEGANRKQRSNAAADRLLELEKAADYRLDQVLIANREARDAVRRLATDERLAALDHIDYGISIPILDDHGQLRAGVQRVVVRCWRETAFLHKLIPGLPISERKLIANMIAASVSDPGPPRFVHQFLRTESVEGSVPHEPLFVTLERFGLLVSAASLTPRMQRRRHNVMRRLRLPGYDNVPPGLMTDAGSEDYIYRYAAHKGMAVLHLDALEHGLRFAHLGFSSVLESFCRQGEFLQQTQAQSGWTTRAIGNAKHAGWLAATKGDDYEEGDELTFFPCGNHLVAEAQAVARMTAERCGHPDGILPAIKHLEKIARKRSEPEPWIFSFDGSPLEQPTVNRFMRFLLAGFGRITFHDLRHAVANAAREDGVPGFLISAALNHKSALLWEWYAQRTERQEWLESRRKEDMRVRRAADRDSEMEHIL